MKTALDLLASLSSDARDPAITPYTAAEVRTIVAEESLMLEDRLTLNAYAQSLENRDTAPPPWWASMYSADPHATPEHAAWMEARKVRTPTQIAWGEEAAAHATEAQTRRPRIEKLREKLRAEEEALAAAETAFLHFNRLYDSCPESAECQRTLEVWWKVRRTLRLPVTPVEGK